MGCFSMFRWAVAIIVTIAVVGMLWADTKFERVDAMPAQQISNTRGSNWLLVGSDSREGLSPEQNHELMTGGDVGGNRTDTIMVLHVPTFGKPTLLSIPRDSYVPIPGYGMDKINAAFSFGGPPLLIETVEQSTGLKIDHYAEVGFGGFANAVDAVGGVDLCVDEPIHDDVINFHLEAGCQEFNGAQALSFVRTRSTAQGDIDRAARQRQFLTALAKKVASPTTFLNPFRSFPLVNGVAGSLTVDSGDHTWHLMWAALHMLGGFNTEVVPVGGMDNVDVGSVVLWDETEAEQLFSSLR
ncbi:Regulatory protein MsrR [Corynebacterium ciconiae DSM 44920]|uniref:LCP family protein n=1 Tax=Corynebacterium ciconiae TaxID=227319 RepID=UPI0003719D65|nr:Regulatory protein MsrR [Corynebacterium ciconiae DSM 44920]